MKDPQRLEELPLGSYVAAFPSLAHQDAYFRVNPTHRFAGRVIRPMCEPGQVFALVAKYATVEERQTVDQRFHTEKARAFAAYKKAISDKGKRDRASYPERLRAELARNMSDSVI